jgi:PAS domain S-box-containing protein
MKYTKVISISILFGLSAWLIDTIIDYLFFFKGGGFFDVLFLEIPAEKYLIRLLLVVLFVLFGLIVVKYLKPLEEIEDEFEKVKTQNKEFLNLTSDIFIALDREGAVVTISDKGAEILGYNKDEIIGANWFDKFIPPRLQYEIRSIYERITLGDIEFGDYNENPVLVRGGREKLIYWHHKVIRNKQNEITGFYLSGIDLTEKSKTEIEKSNLHNEIERQSNLLEMILTSAPDQLMMFDKEGKFTYCNNYTAELFGLSQGELLGKTWKELGLPEKQFKILDIKRELTMVSGKSFTMTLNMPVKNDSREYEYKLTPIRNIEGIFDTVIIAAHDITDKKIREVELNEAKEKAKQSERLKSEFLTQMSHEIRTPLHTILSYISLIKEELQHGKTSSFNESFQSIDVGSKRLLRTIEMILSMSQLQSGTYEPEFRDLDISRDILAGILNEYSNFGKDKNIDIDFYSEIEQPILKLDYYTSSQIFRNLIDNAVKYTTDGSIKVRVFKNKDGKYCVEIVDTGIGISKEYLNNLFEPFSQEESGYTRHYEGNGLGLALTKRYCSLNNAEISVESVKGKGTKFTVVFSNPVEKLS